MSVDSAVRRCCAVPSCIPKHHLPCCSCLKKVAAPLHATRFGCLRAHDVYISNDAQVFNALVVFSEGYVEDPAGGRVPLPGDFLKTGAAAADAFNALPRTCEKMAVPKRSAEEDNDNER